MSQIKSFRFIKSRWVKWTLGVFLAAFMLLFFAYAATAWYINTHKKEMLAAMTSKIGTQLNGSLKIGSMEPTFLTDFPSISLDLRNVEITDRQFSRHKRAFLKSKDIFVAVNAFAFFRGIIEIKKITVSDATVSLYTDESGYSNTSVFEKGGKGDGNGGGLGSELRKLRLNNVLLNIENFKSRKEYRFLVNDLRSNADYKDGGWEGFADLDVVAQRMTFSMKNGSFIKNREVKGKINASYNEETGMVTVTESRLEIGGENFTVAAKLGFGKDTQFQIKLANDRILWKSAAGLLSPNITAKLMMFDLSEPIAVGCTIKGNFNAAGDPLIFVTAKVRSNTLDTAGGPITQCNFDGVFTNNHIKSQGFTDANSAIWLLNFNGTYAEIPFTMKKAYILNLEQPVAVGDFHSEFDIVKMKGLIDPGLMAFMKGKAKVNVTYKADIVNYLLSKPLVEGNISIDSANVTYVPRRLSFNNISVGLNFRDDNLFISNIHLQSGRSIVDMKGEIRNFLNLYYKDPEKIILNWDVKSPQLHLAEFLGFLGKRQSAAPTPKSKKGNFTEELNRLFDKSNVDMRLYVNKLYYNKFLATGVKANLLLTQKGAMIKNAGFKHAGGTLMLNGVLAQEGSRSRFSVNTTIHDVHINPFFKAFNNFGMESLTAENLSGALSSSVKLTGVVSDKGILVPSSMNGKVDFNLDKGRLLHFSTLKSIGKFAFPFRNLDTISFYRLKGQFDIAGEKVNVRPMQINSSLLNMDVEGVYSFGKGTKLYIAVPLRNPEKDKNITDKEELARRRNRGIVIHLIAQDGKDGKVSIGLGKKK